jgi:hypothetical protein
MGDGLGGHSVSHHSAASFCAENDLRVPVAPRLGPVFQLQLGLHRWHWVRRPKGL